jgi:hypothetical protein
MALNFPDPATQTPVNTWSPTSTPSASTNGLTYLWDGTKWGTTGGPDVHVLKAGDTMTGNLTVPSLNSGPLAGFRNQIVNGHMLINQRGQSTYTITSTTNQYTVDRWFCSLAAGTTQATITNVVLSGSHFPVAVSAGGTGECYISQGIPLPYNKQNQFEVGTTWTYSWYSNRSTPMYGSLSFETTMAGGGVTIFAGDSTVTLGNVGASLFRHAITVTVSQAIGANSFLKASIALLPGNNCTGVQLEPGPVATPFELRPEGTELALCQRYYFKTQSSNNSALMTGFCSGSNTVTMVRDLPVTMAKVPVLSYQNLVLQPGALNFTPGLQRHTTSHLSMLATATGVTLGNGYSIETQTGVTGFIAADAEL